jgi:hypothetical protein
MKRTFHPKSPIVVWLDRRDYFPLRGFWAAMIGDNGSCPCDRRGSRRWMQRRESLDHSGFYSRAARGAQAENVAMGSTTRAGAMAQWRGSPGHAANMRLPGCKAVASAVSKSGRRYWTMLIGR